MNNNYKEYFFHVNKSWIFCCDISYMNNKTKHVREFLFPTKNRAYKKERLFLF